MLGGQEGRPLCSRQVFSKSEFEIAVRLFRQQLEDKDRVIEALRGKPEAACSELSPKRTQRKPAGPRGGRGSAARGRLQTASTRKG
jgi:hypothetical protein